MRQCLIIFIAHISLYLFNFKPGHLVVNKCQKEILAIFNLFGVVLMHCINGIAFYLYIVNGCRMINGIVSN